MSAWNCVVVGRGLFGSAAAKYLQRAHGRVLAVGPTGFDSKHGVYSSHNDQGRVVRTIGFDDFWTQLNLQAADGFRALEAETGLQVIHRAGCITACAATYNQSDYFSGDRVQTSARTFGLCDSVQITKSQSTSARLLREAGFFSTSMRAPAVENACYEDAASGAGYLDIPNLKLAQEKAFVSHGGALNDSTVLSIRKAAGHGGGYELRLGGGDNSVVQARNVLVCCGSFCNKHGLLPTGIDVPLHLKTETVLMAKIPSEAFATGAVSDAMPSLLWEVETTDYEGVYMVPPMRYPDGNWYLKIGCNSPEDIHFEASADDDHRWSEISRWFQGTSEDTRRQEEALKFVFREIFPDMPVSDFIPKRCIITRTPTTRPSLLKLDTGLFIATGGNGYGAMCSDGIGSRAAALVEVA